MRPTLRFLMLVSLAGLAVTPAEASRLELVFRPAAGSSLPLSLAGELSLVSIGGTPGAAPETQKVSLTAPFVRDLPPRTTWQVKLRGSGFWAPSPIVFVGEEPVTRSVDLVPAGEIAGEVRVPSAAQPPKALTVRLRPAPGAATTIQPEIEETCPIDPRGRFRCALPAGAFDLRLRAAGFVTQYRWGAQIPRRRAFSVGVLTLRPGASVVGWIEAPTHDFRFADCQVELRPLVLGIQMTPANVERRDSLSLSARANSRGFFELAGMEAGAYTIVVRHPRYAAARVSPVEVAAGTESEIRSVRLELPVELTVEVTPPLDPWGRVWRLELSRRGASPDTYEPVKAGPPTAEGHWVAGGLEPGHYALAVLGSYRSQFLQEEMELVPGPTTHEVRLPFLKVEGEVRLGDEPLMALLWFGGRHGTRRIAAKSGPDGKFEITLPENKEKKPWRVEVINEPERIRGVIPELPVERSPGRDVARVTVALPDTSIRGEVVDEQGQPVPRARVAVLGHDTFTANADEKGRFALRALEPGDWHLEGEAYVQGKTLSSDDLLVRLGREPVDGLQLVLREQQKLSGIVLGPAGQPIPGSYVYPLIEQMDRTLTTYVPATYTDVNGQFEMRLPAAARWVQLTLYPPGFAVKTFRADVSHTPSVSLVVAPVGGTVVLDFGRTPSSTEVWRLDLFGAYDLGPSSAWQNWAALFGPQSEPSKLAIPMLEPGRYTICFGVHPEVYHSGLPPSEPAGRCASGELGPGGTLVLRVPLPKEPEGEKSQAG